MTKDANGMPAPRFPWVTVANTCRFCGGNLVSYDGATYFCQKCGTTSISFITTTVNTYPLGPATISLNTVFNTATGAVGNPATTSIFLQY